MQECDVLIVGGGPAGLSAALYASRSLLKTIVVEEGSVGGQITTTSEIENYLGSSSDDPGELAARMREQASGFGAQIKIESLQSVEKSHDGFLVTTSKETYNAKSVIIATGAHPKSIGCKGEEEFRGLGVSYCATCDANFFRDLDVVVVGGGDSAIEEGIYLTKFARKVTIVHRRDALRATKILQERAFENPKIEFIYDTVVDEIKGDGIVQKVVLRNVKSDEKMELKTDGVFAFVGYNPNSKVFKDIVTLDAQGYILSDENMETNVPGIFAAGDVRQKSLKQVITAAADGAIAAVSAQKYLEE